MSEWISVSHRLPEIPAERHQVTCIVATETFVTAMEFAINRFAKQRRAKGPRWEWQGRISPWRVTHWMPLPKPPALIPAPRHPAATPAIE